MMLRLVDLILLLSPWVMAAAALVVAASARAESHRLREEASRAAERLARLERQFELLLPPPPGDGPFRLGSGPAPRQEVE